MSENELQFLRWQAVCERHIGYAWVLLGLMVVCWLCLGNLAATIALVPNLINHGYLFYVDRKAENALNRFCAE